MALNQKIRLQIISALDDAGIKATADQLDKLQSKVTEAQASAGTLGDTMTNKFSPMKAISSALTGNIEGLSIEMVKLGAAMKGITLSVGAFTGIGLAIGVAVMAVKKLIDVFKEEKSAIDLATEAAEKNARAIQDAQKATRDSIRSAFGKVDDAAKRRDAELEAIEKEVAAEKRLQMETAKRNGDLETAARLQKEITKAAKDEAVKRKQNAISDIDAKIAAVDKQIAGASSYDAKAAEKERRRLNGQIVMARRELKKAEEGSFDPISKAKVVNYSLVDELKNGLKGLEEAKAGLVKKNAEKNVAKGEIDKLKEDRKNLERDLNAFKKIQVADAIKVETDAIKKQNDERLKAEQELHRKRMENLKAEASAAKGDLTSAKTRFEREFALYKNKGSIVQQIEAEKQDADARKQLAKDAARYGGKWRINELSRLYAANDEEGVKNTLAEWRKRKNFTPEVEAMVRAAAAGENVKTMEDRVAEIAENTKGLAKKVEELLSMKGE